MAEEKKGKQVCHSRTAEQMNVWTDKETDGWSGKHVVGWMNERTTKRFSAVSGKTKAKNKKQKANETKFAKNGQMNGHTISSRSLASD